MSRPTLLLVDDNPDLLELTMLTLEENGGGDEVIVARTGPKAIDYLLREGKHKGSATDTPLELVMLNLG